MSAACYGLLRLIGEPHLHIGAHHFSQIVRSLQLHHLGRTLQVRRSPNHTSMFVSVYMSHAILHWYWSSSTYACARLKYLHRRGLRSFGGTQIADLWRFGWVGLLIFLVVYIDFHHWLTHWIFGWWGLFHRFGLFEIFLLVGCCGGCVADMRGNFDRFSLRFLSASVVLIGTSPLDMLFLHTTSHLIFLNAL